MSAAKLSGAAADEPELELVPVELLELVLPEDEEEAVPELELAVVAVLVLVLVPVGVLVVELLHPTHAQPATIVRAAPAAIALEGFIRRTSLISKVERDRTRRPWRNIVTPWPPPVSGRRVP